MQISCTKKNEEFIEFTYGLSMNPEFPRAGIQIKGDNYVYYCEEIMNLGDKYYLNNQTGKYTNEERDVSTFLNNWKPITDKLK